MSEMCCTRLTENTGCKKSLFCYHRTTLSGCIFAAEACIDNRKKNLLNTDTSPTCHNRGRHLHSAGRPSCWALAHILVAKGITRICTLVNGISSQHVSDLLQQRCGCAAHGLDMFTHQGWGEGGVRTERERRNGFTWSTLWGFAYMMSSV